MVVQTKNILIEVGKGALTTALGFGGGCLVGHLAGAPVLLTGGIYAIAGLASYCFDLLAKTFAAKFDWNVSTYKFAQVLSAALLTAATAVTLFAIGILGPVGIGVFIGVGLAIGVGLPLGLGLYAKFGGKDMTYNKAILEKQNPESENYFVKFTV
jgi:hypothetical protein